MSVEQANQIDYRLIVHLKHIQFISKNHTFRLHLSFMTNKYALH